MGQSFIDGAIRQIALLGDAQAIHVCPDQQSFPRFSGVQQPYHTGDAYLSLYLQTTLPQIVGNDFSGAELCMSPLRVHMQIFVDLKQFSA